MKVSEGMLKWALNLYPPMLFQRITVRRIAKGFMGAEVKIHKSLLNKNYNGTIFGGTLFSATDPFYPVLFHQVLTRKGYKMRVWSLSSAIRFNKPALTSLHFKIVITDKIIADCEEVLHTVGKYTRTFPIDIYDKKGQLCVSVLCKIYIRNLNHPVE